MSDKPILFSGPMVRALLDGRKTMTRRVIPHDGSGWFRHPESGEIVGCMGNPPPRLRIARGDRLWCREAWRTAGWLDGTPPRDLTRNVPMHYETDPVDTDNLPLADGKLRPSMFMPRWASRLTLIVTGVKVERLQDISDDDAEAEGCPPCPSCDDVGWMNEGPDGGYQCRAHGCGDAWRDQYRRLWDSINGPGAWDANPWVAAYTFTVHRANIDELGKDAA